MMALRVSGAFSRDWKRVPLEARELIRPFLKRLQQQDTNLDILRMKGLPRNRFRLRTGVYRVIFLQDEEGIALLHVGHRKDIYRHQ